MLHANPSIPSSLLNIPIFVFPAIFFLLLSLYLRLSFPTFRVHFFHPVFNIAGATLVLLILYSLLAVSYSVRHLGPLRALLPFAAHATISRSLATLIRVATYIFSPTRRRQHHYHRHHHQQKQTQSQQWQLMSSPSPTPKPLLLPLLLTTIGLVFLVHDASGGQIAPEHAAHVRERVLRNPTARLMHDHFRNISSRVVQSIHNNSFPSVHIPLHHAARLRSLRRNLRDIPQKPLYPEYDTRSNDPSRRPSPITVVSADSVSQNVSDSRSPVPLVQPVENVLGNHSLSSLSAGSAGVKSIGSKQFPLKNDTTPSLTKKTRKSTTRNGFRDRRAPNGSADSFALTKNTFSEAAVHKDAVGDEALPSVSLLQAMFAVFFGATSPIARRLASDIFEKLIADIGEPTGFLALLFFIASLVLLLFSLPLFSGPLRETALDALDMTFKGSVVGLTAFVIPFLSQIRASNIWRRGPQSRLAKATTSLSLVNVSLLDLRSASPSSASWLYVTCVTIAQVAAFLGWTTVRRAESFSFFSASSAVIFILAASTETASSHVQFSDEKLRGGRLWLTGRSHLPLRLSRKFVLWTRWASRTLREFLVDSLNTLLDLSAHARTNRASWQVLNFLVLQSGMAVAELIYASATHATGLFSISADNFFCSVALAVGLLAIRVSSRKPTLRFSYGFSRIESVCGFANGVMLIYVALLIFLEAFERISDSDEHTAVGRAVSVCLFGIVGNALGLYFFPPETRRENHNVQGIYLHILANTLAFSSVAVSAATSAILPSRWQSIDICTAAIASCSVVASAVPLIVRSGRLLLLMVSPEKQARVQSLEQRLRCIDGVCALSGIRVWNLTPNFLMASVKLEVLEESDELYSTVFSSARAIFAMAGIAASQCTIQISCRKNITTGEAVHLQRNPGSVQMENCIDDSNGSIFFLAGEATKEI